MDTHRLKYFLQIADEGSISRAATVLGVAQPALSRQIRLLEEDLGVTLFRRTSRGVELTEDGDRLRAGTAGPLRQLELAVHYIGSPLARVERGLHLGMLPTTIDILAAPLLTSLSATFPRVNFHVTAAGTDQLIEGMLKSAIDVAIVNPTSDDRLFRRDLLVEDLVAVGGPASGLRPDQPLTFTELVARPLVLPASHTGIASTVQNAALRMKMRLDSRFATDSLDLSKNLAESGLALTVLPVSACRADLASGRLTYAPIHEPVLTHQLGVAATVQLELPREFAFKLGNVLREEVARLTASGAWPGTFLAAQPWDPNIA